MGENVFTVYDEIIRVFFFSGRRNKHTAHITGHNIVSAIYRLANIVSNYLRLAQPTLKEVLTQDN